MLKSDKRSLRIVSILLGVVWLLSALAAGVAMAKQPGVEVLTVKGPINPVVANYIKRGIGEAESRGAAVCVIQLDTPGGLDSSMRDIIQRILGSKVPVVVYVYPPGARAASAGAFIAMASHVAAMAPNTAIGAAHPVAIGGGEITGPEADKILNDSVAYIKSLAQAQGRNVDWAERAVRDSISSTEQEARAQGVIEVVAPDLNALLFQLDGRQVGLLSGSVILRTQGLPVYDNGMNWIERFLLTISDPNIAYILLGLAMLGIFFEMANPGSILPGVIGGISLVLALFSLGMLPVNYAGVALIALAFLLFFLEIWITSYGLLSIGGVASLVVGSLILISSSAPYFQINRWLIAGTVILIAAFFVLVVGAIVAGQRRRPVSGQEDLVGRPAIARTALDPRGKVFVEGEIWNAEVEDGKVGVGEEVIITRVEGLKVYVSRKEGGK
ncbi:MAG: nodulation protein NfeD [Dehalococcoidia bacterium]|nr:nodulation protein NfeD [Dehalococcoidia bacterium]